MAHVAKWKKTEVEELKDLLLGKPIVAIVGLENIPARQMQKMRTGLRGKSQLRMSRNRLINLAIDMASEENPDLAKLKEHIHGNTALMATDLNPFKLYRLIEAMETSAPAKPGDVVDDEIKLKKGDTPFKPGPIVGDLQKVGIPAAIDSGKVIIRKDFVLLKAGDTVNRDQADVMARLEILPMSVGISTRAVLEGDTVFTKDALGIDIHVVRGQFAMGSSRAMNLAMHIGYTTPQTIVPLLGLAHTKALALCLHSGIITSETVSPLLAKARTQMLALASRIGDGLDDELKGMVSSASQVSAPKVKAEEKAEEPEEEDEEEVTEEEAAAGLGALFG